MASQVDDSPPRKKQKVDIDSPPGPSTGSIASTRPTRYLVYIWNCSRWRECTMRVNCLSDPRGCNDGVWCPGCKYLQLPNLHLNAAEIPQPHLPAELRLHVLWHDDNEGPCVLDIPEPVRVHCTECDLKYVADRRHLEISGGHLLMCPRCKHMQINVTNPPPDEAVTDVPS